MSGGCGTARRSGGVAALLFLDLPGIRRLPMSDLSCRGESNICANGFVTAEIARPGGNRLSAAAPFAPVRVPEAWFSRDMCEFPTLAEAGAAKAHEPLYMEGIVEGRVVDERSFRVRELWGT